jgi:hypothetical protein
MMRGSFFFIHLNLILPQYFFQFKVENPLCSIFIIFLLSLNFTLYLRKEP